MSYTIRQVATQFHMQPSTLRYYEDQGLLTNVERTETGQAHIRRLPYRPSARDLLLQERRHDH